MKIVLIGKDGQIGKSLFNILKGRHEILPLGKKECNLLIKDEITSIFNNIKADLVINSAAYTDVDKAESDKNRVFSINSDAVHIISSLTKKHNIPFINYSTDYVFDGESNKKYSEEDIENPINIYGKSKLDSEENTKINDQHIIIRTSSVFSLSGNNFINKIIDLAEKKDRLDIVDDQFITPTSSEFISSVTDLLITHIEKYKNNDVYGTYHVVAGGSCSWYDYAKVIISEVLKNNYPVKTNLESIYAISSRDYNSIAKRPPNAVLSTNKIKSFLSVEIPKWENDVKSTIKGIIKRKIK